MKKSIEFTVKPEWDEIEEIRNDSAEFLQAHELSDDTIHSLSMIISELIENGIKYGNFKMVENRVSVIINIDRNTVTIEVLNPVDEDADKHLSRLDKTIQWIRGYQDPFEAYMVMKKMSPKQTRHGEAEGIGLAEIAYEGNATLDFFISEDNILNLSAVKRLA